MWPVTKQAGKRLDVQPEELQADGNRTNKKREKPCFHHLFRAVQAAQPFSRFLREKVTGLACFVLPTMPASHGWQIHLHPAYMRYVRRSCVLQKTPISKDTLTDHAGRNYSGRCDDINQSARRNIAPDTIPVQYNHSSFDIRHAFIEPMGACSGREQCSCMERHFVERLLYNGAAFMDSIRR